MRVLADGGPPLDLTCLFVCERFILFDQREGDGQRDFVCAVERGQEIDALDAGTCGVVVVPADQLALVGVRLVGDAIVHDQHRVFALDLAHERLDDLPQVRRRVRLLGQKPRDLIVAEVRLQEPRQPRGCGWTERRDQIVGIQIEQRLVHSRILPDENHILGLQSRNADAMSA